MLFRLKSPALLLAALLQVLPVVRTLCLHPATASTFAIILRWTIGSTAAFGAVDAVSGATTVFTSPATFSGATGTPFSNNVVVSIGGGSKAAADDYFILSSATATSPLLLNNQSTTVTLPPGLTFKASWINGATTIGGIIYGTPTIAGSYPTTVTVVSPGNASLPQKITITITSSVTPTAPAIISQPAGTNIIAGKTATFTVAANGSAPLGYFWSKGGAPLTNTGNISGANTAALTVANVSAADAGSYSVFVSNSINTVTSTSAALTVISPPAITRQPAGLSTATGGSAQFAATATGSAPLNYRWLKGGIGLTNGVKFSGVNSNILSIATIATTDAGNYSVAITNLAGSITSSVAALTVVSSPTIVTPPASQTVAAGASASFTVTAAGSTPLAYRWLKNTAPLTDGGNVSGSATATLTLSSISTTDAASYSVSVSNNLGSVTSSAATLTVAFAPTILTPPAAVTVLTGSNASFTVTASGTAPLNYQWLKNGVAISGATSTSLSLANVSATDAASYSVTVTNSVGGLTSGNAALTVLSPPAIITQPTNQIASLGNPITLTVEAAGTGPLGYQWFKGGSTLADGGNLSGSTSNILTIAALTTNDVNAYFVVVSNFLGSATSTNASIAVAVVNVAPSITKHPVSQVTAPNKTVALTVTATGTGPLAYQWKKNGVKLANGGNISGATTPSLTLANVNVKNNGSYSVVVTNSYGSTNSAPASLTVLATPIITKSPVSRTVKVGANVVFKVTAKGDKPLIYQWLKNGTALVDGGNIYGVTGKILKISNITAADTAIYSVIVSNLAGSTASGSALLTLLSPFPSNSNEKNITSLALSARPATANVIVPAVPLVISQIVKNGSGITLNCAGTAGAVYVLQATSDFANWTGICTNTADADGQWQATDNTDAACRFYRIRSVP